MNRHVPLRTNDDMPDQRYFLETSWEIWPFHKINASSDLFVELFLNLISEVSASTNGADVVHLGAVPSSRRRGVGATLVGAELGRRRAFEVN
jgi:hypothetical protein